MLGAQHWGTAVNSYRSIMQRALNSTCHLCAGLAWTGPGSIDIADRMNTSPVGVGRSNHEISPIDEQPPWPLLESPRRSPLERPLGTGADDGGRPADVDARAVSARARRRIARSSARLQAVIKKVHINNDRDGWGRGSGELSLYIRFCPDERRPDPCTGQDGVLSRYDFSADSGRTSSRM